MSKIKFLSGPLLPLAAVVMIWAALGFFIQQYSGGSPSQGHWNKRWWNEETAFHTLNTLRRYEAFAIKDHWFAVSPPLGIDLKCETFEDLCHKHVDADKPSSAIVSSPALNGATVYSSFPPGAFVISYPFVNLINDITGIPELSSIRIWNWTLALVTSLLFCASLLRLSPTGMRFRNAIIIVSCLPLLAAVEPLHSHHQSLWAHQVFQPILAGCILLLTYARTSKNAAMLGLLCFIGSWVEWTAYLMCIALFFVVAIQSSRGDRLKNTAIFTTIAGAGGLTLLAYYALLLGTDRYFSELFARFSSRTVTVDYLDWTDWVVSLFQSYGAWIVAALVLFIERMTYRKSNNLDGVPDSRKIACMVVVSAFLLIENALMFEHAIVYTFDRLKWGFLLGLLIYWFSSAAVADNRKSIVLSIAVPLLATAYSISAFMDIYKPYWK